MNWYGCYTLFKKEIRRFQSVIGQTVAAPVITAMLYLLVFRQVLEDRVQVYDGVAYTAFLIPGLIMMSIIQNAFANTSSSITQSKVMGNLVFVLMTPLSAFELYVAYIGAALVRAALVAGGLFLMAQFFVRTPLTHPLMVLAMLFLAGGTLAVLGLIAGILADKFEHLAAFQNFFIMPLSFLSGVFYSIHSLPDFWRAASHYNPFFYMIDGFRYGFFGVGDVGPWQTLAVVSVFFVAVSALAITMLARGTRIRS
ncbi:ABC transporter permease [Spectribacter hydrogenooxidans]|uniref:Transport permease protein n=1 Tax=Spectribacter hydrogenoxidans TaxID=3075608 RepID=A0ABU3BX25_9GAMM|nr:ABC transporter permease [Salinisphaera sp. W335]MDT0633851.1 ABC transporter permease [Salinisphaera sp. W335]